MKMPMGNIIEELVTKVRLANDRKDDIKAFGELWIYLQGQTEPTFKNKGFTIRLKEFRPGKKVLAVVFPAFHSPKSKTGYQTSFIIENKSLYEDVRQLFLDEYAQVSGGLTVEDVENLDEEIEDTR